MKIPMVRYYTVIPATRLPRTAPDEYTYAYSDDSDLETNTLVSIPFRNATTPGLITGTTRHKPPFTVKSIKKVVRDNLPPHFPQFLFELSRLTFEHPGTLLRLSLLHASHHAEPLPLHNKNHLNKINKTKIHQYQSMDERVAWLTTRAQKASTNNRTLLIVIPNVFEATLVSELMNTNGVSCALFTGSNSNRTRVNTPSFASCLVSTRVGCLLPFAFNEIICDDEPNDLHIHNEPSPPYDTRTVMLLRASILKESLTYSGYSLTLSIQTYLNTNIGKDDTPTIPHNNPVKWISIPNNLRVNKTPITEAALEALQDIHNHNLTIVAQSSGYSKIVTCNSCGFKLTCPSCGRPCYASTSEELQCSRCSINSSIPPFCPICSGHSFRYRGFGAFRVKEVLSKIKTFNYPITLTSFGQFEQGIKSQPPSSLFIPHADSLLPPTFDGEEQFYHRLIKLILQTRPQKLVIQYSSERLKNNVENPHSFMLSEQQLRVKLNLPPKRTLLQLRYYSPNVNKKRQLSFEQAKHALSTIFTVEDTDIQGVEQQKRRLPYYLFYLRIDPLRLLTIEWKKIPVGFHCLQCR